MSIHLFCHLDRNQPEAAEILRKISDEHADMFSQKFLLGGVKESREIDKEIAAEHDFVSRTFFSIRLNVKDESIRLKEVANLMRSTFGEDRILVLFDNSTLF